MGHGKKFFPALAFCMVLVFVLASCGGGGSGEGDIKSWTGVVEIDAGDYDADNPQVAVDANGNAFAVWEQSDGTYYRIYARCYDTGTGWGTAEIIDESTNYAHDPQVAFDANGSAFVVWRQFDGNWNIYANRYDTGTGWGTADIIDEGAYDASYPKVAFDANGNAVAVWEQSDGTYDRIYTNRYVAGSGWGMAEVITAGANNAYYPQVAVAANGNAFAVWRQDYDIYANRYMAGTGWSTAEIIDSGDYSASSPQVAVDANGNAVAVWYQDDGRYWSIYANRYDSGTGWGTAAEIDAGAHHASYPKVAFDANGNAFAVWRQDYDIYANRYMAGTGWSTAEIIDSGDYSASSPQMAVAANGNAVAVWCQWDGTSAYDIYANRYDTGTGWGTADIIDADTKDASPLQVAVDANGIAIAVWQSDDSTSTTSSIYAYRYE